MAKVLIIDDDESTREAVAWLLRAYGHEIVGEAQNGVNALALLASGCKPNVILLDLWMPVMNGWEFLAAVQGRAGVAIPPIVVFSSDPKLLMKDPPVVAAIHKGMDADQLMDAVNSAAAGSA